MIGLHLIVALTDRSKAFTEIDFVVNNVAYEVKISQKQIRKSKYKLFQQKYPEMKLQFIDAHNVLDLI